MGGVCCCCLCCECCVSAGALRVAEEVNPDVLFTGKTVIVTGANTGVGKEAARVFALRGARVILACRNTTAGQEAVDEIKASVGAGTSAGSKGSKKSKAKGKGAWEMVSCMRLDLGDLSSVYAFVDEFEKLGAPCDVLVNNAGVMNTPKQTTTDGLEYQFGINHIGHFALTTQLIDRGLMAKKDARIITLTSEAHKLGSINFDDLMFENRSYGGWPSYGQSKLANMLFTRELRTRYGDAYTVAAVHPGVVETEIFRTTGGCMKACSGCTNYMKNIPQGAATTIWVATADRAEIMEHPSLYFKDCGRAKDASKAGQNDDTARRLWEASEAILAEHGPKRAGKGTKGKGKKASSSASDSGAASSSG